MLFLDRKQSHAENLSQSALRRLSQADPALGSLIRQIGPCRLGRAGRNNHFAALVEAIIYQQLAGKAAAVIFSRFRALYSSRRFPTPEKLDRTPEKQLRSAGLSPQKISYLKDLSRRLLDGSLKLRNLSPMDMDDEEIIAHLTQVKGIGRWTAEMFLIFCLGRLDVLPVGDLGIRKAVQKAYRLRALPSPERLEQMGRRWQPYRSVASWYLWASVDGK